MRSRCTHLRVTVGLGWRDNERSKHRHSCPIVNTNACTVPILHVSAWKRDQHVCHLSTRTSETTRNSGGAPVADSVKGYKAQEKLREDDVDKYYYESEKTDSEKHNAIIKWAMLGNASITVMKFAAYFKTGTALTQATFETHFLFLCPRLKCDAFGGDPFSC